MKTLYQSLKDECDGQCTYLHPKQVIYIVKRWLMDSMDKEDLTWLEYNAIKELVDELEK
jgi:hypothetical protein